MLKATSLLAVFAFSGCVIPSTQTVPNAKTKRVVADSDSPHRIEIFFDGTKNKWDSRTNVRRRFEMVAAVEDPNFKCFYVDGVGNESWIAAAFGIGMKARVVEGYKFLASHWTPETRVRIFGFSRGSLQARMLAGMMAHSGLPVAHADGSELTAAEVDEIANEVWAYSREHLKDPHVSPTDPAAASIWNKELARNRTETRNHIRSKLKKDIKFENPDIEFMGIWDTVPGLTLSELKENGEEFKDTGKEGGTRYKVRPYPNIRVIAHALALDERRNKFAPLRVGGPLDPKRTIVHEVWFPGAHSDVGGGYADSNDMAGITFTWVHLLLHHHGASSRESRAYSDASGILHHPEARRFYTLVGGTKRRVIPIGSYIDRTVFSRANATNPPEQAGRGYVHVPYRPVLTLDDKAGTTVVIGPTKDPAKALRPHLLLNDSKLGASQQKTVKQVVEPAQLQLKVEKSKEPELPQAQPEAKKADTPNGRDPAVAGSRRSEALGS